MTMENLRSHEVACKRNTRELCSSNRRSCSPEFVACMLQDRSSKDMEYTCTYRHQDGHSEACSTHEGCRKLSGFARRNTGWPDYNKKVNEGPLAYY